MNIAIVGATGIVGREILKILNQKKLIKNNNIFLYASKNSENKIITIGKDSFIVRELNKNNLEKKFDYALFSAGGKISKVWAKEFINRGAVVIDNSSQFRRDKNVPLVVPEINIKTAKTSKLIANPNCSTIGASLPVYEMSKIYKVKRIIISTYQAVSGAGKRGLDDLKTGKANKFDFKIKNNLIPQIDVFCENGYTFEEDKMQFELKKILNNNKLKISTTCVRVPIKNCHSESVFIEFYEKPDINQIKTQLKNTKGIKFVDVQCKQKYPMPLIANGKNDVFVGRLRYDTANCRALSFFICFDNIRKGAALNAVQILESLICKE